jgi:hypothetical protein
MNIIMKFGLKYYWHPTPKKIRLFGDSLAAASVFVSTMTILEGHKELAIAVFVSGWVGKFLSNMFADDNQKADNNSSEASN